MRVDRLTQRLSEAVPEVTCAALDMAICEVLACEDCEIQAIVNRLAAYEDTGAIPEQCAASLKLLEMKEAGKVEELPCGVGDTVWHISKGINGGRWMPVTSHMVTNIYLNIGKEPKFKLTETYGTFKISDFGKTVFLTRAEAEKAMEEGK